MAFEGLSQKLQGIFRTLTGKGKLSEAQVKEAMREVRLALLEADVNFAVAKDFCARLTEKATGTEILESLTPGQQVVKLVHQELTALMGPENSKIKIASAPPTVIMLCGLQGAGKTTFAAKLAHYFVKQGKKPLLVACDIYRPAAILQLQTVGAQAGVPVFEKGTQKPWKTAAEAIAHAKSYLNDIVILDTAGRLHIDEALMDELRTIKDKIKPHEILLCVDAMTGQDAVTVAGAFHQALGIEGIVLTKTDGDTRGGAALSVKAVTGRPIKFASAGEKIADLEPFYPERMASRILGMGDVLTLIEKAQEQFNEQKAAELEQKMRAGFDLEDFLEQFAQLKKMGSLTDILGMLPGVDKSKINEKDLDQKQFGRMEAIIRSMTIRERRNPDLLNASRRKRIAAGSGTSVQDINRLIRQFEQAKQMMKQFKGKKRFGKLPF